ncbi:M48 family metallopeptidase [Adhaeribacter soli]|uniref:M48 family metalloprotease n=1 Tax=Adhaeribacter soli TaxID=2607655 RepID=A0A5N1J1L0_9BACT|nr:M48 family metallopeptidase [Adhaeribacter soli]KAA9340673.1 M48 family metalloprotease [Adhaeribacter soli]
MLKRLHSLCLLTCLFGTQLAFSQTSDWFKYKFPAQTPEAYKVPLPEKYRQVLGKNQAPTIKLRDSERFSEDVAYAIKRELSMGNIYYGFTEMEDYLNQVMYRILPDSLKNNGAIKVYIARSPEENASAMPEGSIFFNIGMLPNMKDEATLAYLLGHELTHYLYTHGRNGYMGSLKSQRKLNRLIPFADLILNAKQMKYSRLQESEADSVGFNLAYKAGYDPQGMVALTKILLDLEKRHELQESKTYEASLKSYGSHPATMLRFQTAMRFQKNASGSNTHNFIVDEEKFNRLKALATQEKLNLMASQNSLISVVSNAYVAHLSQPENPHYLMLLVEGIRKMVYADQTLGDRGFLTAHMQHNYFAKKEGITKNLGFLLPDSNLVAALNAQHPTLNQASYQTYDQAFAYFAGKAEAANLTEVHLSKALYYAKNEKQRTESLERYLASPEARYPEFAQALLRQDLNLPAGTRKLLLIDDIAYTKDYLYGYRNSWLESEQKQAAQQLLLTSYFKGKGTAREIHFATDYFTRQTEEAVAVFDMMSVWRQADRNNYNYFQLGMYEPAYWQYCKDHQIGQVEFFSINALDKTYKKFRHYFALPPLTAFYAYRMLFALSNPNNRYAFSIQASTLNISGKNQNFGGKQVVKRMRLTDKRLVRQVHSITAGIEKELKSDKLKKN